MTNRGSYYAAAATTAIAAILHLSIKLFSDYGYHKSFFFFV